MMHIVSSTDGKYLGEEISEVERGDTIRLSEDFEFSVMYKFELENGNVTLGSPNYQIEIEE